MAVKAKTAGISVRLTNLVTGIGRTIVPDLSFGSIEKTEYKKEMYNKMHGRDDKIKDTVNLGDIASYILSQLEETAYDADSFISIGEKKIAKVIEDYLKLMHQTNDKIPVNAEAQSEILMGNLLDVVYGINQEFFIAGMKYGAGIILELLI